MSMNENTSVDTTDSVDNTETDLNAFEAEFFGRNPATPEPASSEEVDENLENVEDALDDDTQSDDDTVEPEDELEEELEETPKPKKKQTAQERINEVISKQREAERERDALRAEIERLKTNTNANTNKQNTPELTPKTEQSTEAPAAPTPDDLDEDGNERYPLGEFDPQYIRDLTKFTLRQEREAMKAQEAIEAEQSRQNELRNEMVSNWEQQRATAQERYPDFQEKSVELVSAFEGIDPGYGDYLSTTIMSMDKGTDVLYYLANNPDIAHQIVQSGAARATLSLGRIEAMFMDEGDVDLKPRPKVSKAPSPPVRLNRGSAVATPSVSVDTDDLDAFSAEFFKRKR